MNDPAFRAELSEARQQLLAEGAHRLAGAMTTAVDTLVAIAEDGTVSPSVRVAAAGRLLENAVVCGDTSLSPRSSFIPGST